MKQDSEIAPTEAPFDVAQGMLCVFAGNIPTLFGCGAAACASAVNTSSEKTQNNQEIRIQNQASPSRLHSSHLTAPI